MRDECMSSMKGRRRLLRLMILDSLVIRVAIIDNNASMMYCTAF